MVIDLDMMKRINYEETLMQKMVFWAFKKIQNSTIQSILICQTHTKLIRQMLLKPGQLIICSHYSPIYFQLHFMHMPSRLPHPTKDKGQAAGAGKMDL